MTPRVVIDATEYAHHPMELSTKPGMAWMLGEIAQTVKGLGYETHVVLQGAVEMYENGISYWPQERHPEVCDVFISPSAKSALDIRTVKTLAGDALTESWPAIAMPSVAKVPGKMVWMAGAGRGLWHLLEMWDSIKQQVPHASVVVGHNPKSYVDIFSWQHDFQGLFAMRLQEFLARDDVTALNNAKRSDVLRHVAEAELFAYPADPISPRDGHRSLSAYEAARAGCALLFAPSEKLGEDYDGVAGFIENPWHHGQWVETIAHWLTAPAELQSWQQKASRWASKHTRMSFQKGWRTRLAQAA